MSLKKKIIIWAVVIIVALVILNFLGIAKVNLTQRYVYNSCPTDPTGCNTNPNDLSDCYAFGVFLKKNDQNFTNLANTAGINLDKPDRVTKNVSTDGKVICRYYAN